MAYRSDAGLLVLLALRLRSFAPVDTVSRHADLPEADVQKLLDLYDTDGLVRFRDGRMRGWSLTAEGRKEGERLLADEVDGLGIRDEVASAYEGFLVDNPTLLELCTDWQMLPGPPDQATLNTHDDPDYDGAVIARLVDLNEGSRGVWRSLSTHLQRFESYGPRFEHALQRVTDDDHDWFTKPSIDSYHTVWFELHEHLLATLGIERATEAAP